MADTLDLSQLSDFNKVPEVAQFFRTSDKSIYRLIQNGRIGYIRCGGIRIRRDHVLAYLEANTHQPAPRKEPVKEA